jgi:hypothetical protein
MPFGQEPIKVPSLITLKLDPQLLNGGLNV